MFEKAMFVKATIKNIIVLASLFLLHLPALAVATTSSDEAGIAAFNKGDYRQSVILLDQILSAHPEDARAWYYRALAYEKSGSLGAAKIAFNDVISRCPDSKEASLAKLALSQLDSGTTTTRAAVAVHDKPSVASPEVVLQASDDKLPDQGNIPFETINDRTVVTAFMSGATLPMEYDTGSDQVLISKNLCDQYGVHLPNLGAPTALYKDGRKAWLTHMEVNVGEFKRPSCPVLVLAEGSWPAHVLLGNSFFQGFIVEKNNKYGQLVIKKAPLPAIPTSLPIATGNTGSLAATQAHYSHSGLIEIPFVAPKGSNRMLVTGKVNGTEVQLLFDSGATPGVSFTYQQLDALQVPAVCTFRTHYYMSGIPYKTAYFDVDFGVFQSEHIAGKVVDKNDATWGTAYPLIGPDVFEHQGYAWSVDHDAKVIVLKRME